MLFKLSALNQGPKTDSLAGHSGGFVPGLGNSGLGLRYNQPILACSMGVAGQKM